MPAMRTLLRNLVPSCFGSTERDNCCGGAKYIGGSKQYRRQPSDNTSKDKDIRKTTGVSVYHTERSESDVEPIIQPGNIYGA